MTNLSVRKLDKAVYEQLRIRAIEHGVSMEEEARRILSQAVLAPEKISDIFRKHFGRQKGINLNLSKRRKPHQPMDFDE